jgi:hypothetical protein
MSSNNIIILDSGFGSQITFVMLHYNIFFIDRINI